MLQLTLWLLLVALAFPSAADPCVSIQSRASEFVENLSIQDGCGISFTRNGPGFSQNLAALWLRTLFHDGGTWFALAAIEGIDGSILNELDAVVNRGLEASLVIQNQNGQLATNPLFNSQLSDSPVTGVDNIAIAAMTAINHCGGPMIDVSYGRNFVGFGAGDTNPGSAFNQSTFLPSDPTLSSNELFARFFLFPGMGLSKSQMFVLVTGSHSLGGAHREVTPLFTRGNDFLAFDDTPSVFDNDIFVKLFQNSSDCVLPIDCNMAQDPDLQNDLQLYASNQTAFFEAYTAAMKAFLTFNPSLPPPTATPPAASCPFMIAKHRYSSDSKEGNKTVLPHIALPTPSGAVRVRTFSYQNGTLSGTIIVQNLAFQKVVTVAYQDGNGVWSTANTFKAAYQSQIAEFPGYEIWSFSSSLPSIRSFYVAYSVSGTIYYDNNGGANYPISGFRNLSTAPVVVANYAFDGTVFSGVVVVKNLAYAKNVTVLWYDSLSSSWENKIACSYSNAIPAHPGFEAWTFSKLMDVGSTAITLFYIEYDVNGQTFFDNNLSHNYSV